MPLSTIFQLYHGSQLYWWEETGVPWENHRPVTSHWQTLSHNIVIEYTSPWMRFELTTLVVINTDCTGSCKSNYHTIMATMAPPIRWGKWYSFHTRAATRTRNFSILGSLKIFYSKKKIKKLIQHENCIQIMKK